MSTYEERAKARSAWPIRKFALGAEPEVDTRVPEDVSERLRMVATLTRAQWAFAGLPLPTYGRADMPGHVTRRR